MECYKCKGTGKLEIRVSERLKLARTETMTCIYCDGSGAMTAKQHAEQKELDDAWCKCETPGDPVPYRYANGAHGFDCSKCGGLLQTG